MGLRVETHEVKWRGRRLRACPGRALDHGDDPIGIRIGQSFEEDAIGQAEYGGIRPYAKSEAEHDQEIVDGTAQDPTPAVASLFENVLHVRPSSRKQPGQGLRKLSGPSSWQ